MGENIIIGILTGLAANLLYDRLKSGSKTHKRNGAPVQRRRGPRWFLIVFSVIPGFFLGGLLALFSVENGIIAESEIYSTSFYVFIGIGSVLSYIILNRIFRRR